MRGAHELMRAEIAAASVESGASEARFPVSFFQRADGPLADLSAYRSAGFRVRIVRPERNGPATVQLEGRDQLSITGGRLLDLFDPDLAARLANLDPAAGVSVLHLSLAGGTDLSGAPLAVAAEAAVAAIDAAIGTLGLRPVLARDYFLLAGTPVPRDIALLLDAADPEGNIEAFANDLVSRNLPFSRTDGPLAPGDCALPASPGATLADCILSPGGLLSPTDAASTVVGPHEANGLGDDIRMHLRQLDAEAAARLDRLTLAESDRVLAIAAKDVASRPMRARMMRWLEDGQNQGYVRLHDLPALRDRVMVSDPVIRRYWSLRRRRLTDPPATGGHSRAERARLMEDAVLAWSYFQRHTYAETGLVAGTVSGNPGGRVNSEITLWDVASQINALIAAAELGLTDTQAASEAIRKAVASLPAERLGQGLLPPSNFSGQTLRTTVRGFDSCDAGRFGIALARAEARGLIDGADIEQALGRWTLDQSIREGGHFSNRDGRWQDTTESHCTDYIVPGFAFLGQALTPLYDRPDPSPESEIVTLYRAASLGAISTEPYALQAIETGMDGPTRLILDALFDAQLGWFQETGQIRCISEAPIDRPPWFIYSGLRIDVEGPDAWVIGAILREAEVASEGFRRANEIISAKAAYLWSAVYPHAYNDRLVAIIRERARIPGVGFTVGVYADSLEPMRNYTDINTNGIILSAIAHMLRPA